MPTEATHWTVEPQHVRDPIGLLMLALAMLEGCAGSASLAFSIVGEAIWNDYRCRWTRWNHVCTVDCMITAALFILALQ